jgi:hypothetical protein
MSVGNETLGPGRGVRLGINRMVRHVALLGLASVAAGVLVGGVGGRVVMRVSALAAGEEMRGGLTENGNRIGEITFGGTLALVVFAGALGGILASVVVVASEPWLRWLGRVRGFGFGLVVLAVFGDFTSSDFVVIQPTTLNVSMFLGLALVFGLVVQIGYRSADRRSPKATDQDQVGYLVVCGLGGWALLANVLFFTSPNFCGCEPATWMGIALLVLLASTAIRYASEILDDVPRWSTVTATVTGYGSLGAVFAVGIARVVDEIVLVAG